MKKVFILLSFITILLAGCNKTENFDEKINEEKENITNNFEEEVVPMSGDVLVEETEDENLEITLVPASSSNLDNTTCAWGFVRKSGGLSPEFAAKYTKPLDEYDGIYKGSSELPKIYLTFDEGYENGYTGTILDTLKEHDVTAAFFVTMPYVKQNPDLVQRMIDEGHIVGNHTVNHPSMPEVADDDKLKEEVTKLHDYILEKFNYEMTYIRPPKGEYSERTVKICKDLGYTHVLWSSAYDDWNVNNQKGAQYAKKMIINYAHNGCVMLLHAVSKDNNEVLGEIIESLRDNGYEFYSLDDFER